MAKIATPSNKNSSAKSGRPLTQSEKEGIEKLAYQFYAERGYQHGFDTEDWLRAEAVVRSRRS